MNNFCQSDLIVIKSRTKLPDSILSALRRWHGLTLALLLVVTSFFGIRDTAHAQTVVGTKFSIASGWAGWNSASDGTNFLVALQSDRATGKVAAQLVSPSGIKIGSVIPLGHDGLSCCAAGAAFDGTNYLVAWEETSSGRTVVGQFLNKSGEKVGQAFAMTTSGIFFDGLNMLSYGGGKYLLTYTRPIGGNNYVAGRIISTDGSMGNEIRISDGLGYGASVTFGGVNGGNFFVVWKDNSNGYEVRGRFVSPTGNLGQGMFVNASPAPSDNTVMVAFDGTNYMVVWEDETPTGWDVFTQRVSANDGTLIGDAIPITNSPGSRWVMGATYDGTNHLISWLEANEGTSWDIYGQLVSKEGVLVGNRFAINTDAENQMGRVECFGARCLAVVSSGIVISDSRMTQVGEVYGSFISYSTIALSVAKAGTGFGTVSSNPEGINCGATCNANFNTGTSVSLAATPAIGSTFAGWSGACSGTGSCTVSMTAAMSVTATFTLATPSSRLVNLSTRGSVQTGDNVMIGGFVIGGSTPKKVLIRAVGPNLANYGVTGVLADPTLQLFSGSTAIAANNDWQSASNAADIQATGLAPSDSKESAILTTLNPGAYTAIVSGMAAGTGVGIVEVYELDNPASQFTNISTRGQVLTGDNVMIGGFVIQGDTSKTVLIRAVGPNLANYGVTGVLANPMLQLFSGSTMIASNDDWGTSTNATAIQVTGLAPVDPKESAILITLPPGAYTAVVSGSGGGTGVGIVEVYAQ